MPVPPRLLALDTATDTLYLALCGPRGVQARAVAGGAQASAALLPLVGALLDEAGASLADLDALAYGQGPGAFTGLRTACSVVQGLALGAGRPVLALDTLAAVVACAHRRHPGMAAAWAMQDARMGEVYAARYAWQDGGWHCTVPAALYRPAALAERVAAEPHVLRAGNALRAHPALCRDGDAPDAVPDGEALIVLAEQAWHRGDLRDPADALPVYVRDKVAMTTAERADGLR